jgi:hypothetical protein
MRPVWTACAAAIAAIGGGCALGEVDLEGKGCPCAAGWVCDVDLDTCFPRAADGGASDAGVDATSRDARREDADRIDGGPDARDAGVADTGASDAGPPPDLLVWLTMDEPARVGEIADVSGHEHHAVCVPACPSTTPGRVGQAIDLDGATYLRIPHADDLDVGVLTVTAWIRAATTSTAYRGVVARPWRPMTDVQNAFALFHTQGDKLTFETYSGGPDRELDSAPGTIVLGTWMHVAGTLDAAGTKRLYVDGAMAGIATEAPIALDPSDILIGADIDVGLVNDFFEGAVDDVRIYSRALGAAEIAALAAAP